MQAVRVGRREVEVLQYLHGSCTPTYTSTSISAWACPILVRLKKDSKPDDVKLKIICDFKRLNQVTLPDAAMRSWMVSVVVNGMLGSAMPPEVSINIQSPPTTDTRLPWYSPRRLEELPFNRGWRRTASLVTQSTLQALLEARADPSAADKVSAARRTYSYYNCYRPCHLQYLTCGEAAVEVLLVDA